ncbi:MAG: amino acid permease [Acidobacteria bacterium Pan2503]|uniref:Amino acid permease n=1 Tax=Candidatus Acidiferrum panamense TaxID=2741543 RepID=A0A7V8NW73_9BACT|nr:amino acid permease [Candidatus Acidoferrum panamensis]
MASPLFATKSVETLMRESGETGEHCLKRALGPINLVTLGIGAIIGAGIFVITGQAAAQFAGPAIVISFVLAGIACAFAGLCYAEFASLIPIAGSAYTYSYATLGELIAWIIGWDLILEYAFGAATVAVGWSGHLRAFMRDLGWNLPAMPTSSLTLLGIPVQLRYDYVGFLVIVAVTTILVIGIKESANLTTAIVILKVAVVCMFIALATMFLSSHAWKPNFWHPFIPANTGTTGEFGWSGILRGAGVVFFAYIGFDAVSTAAQEAKNPKKDMPFGILGSLVICTVLYILVSGLLTHLVPYTQLNVPDPVVVGVRATGHQWATFLVELGALAGLATVMLVMLLGQSRVFYSMSRDGLLWPWASKIHARFRTPYISSMVVGIFVAILATLLPLHILDEMTSVGTLLAFVLVSAGVWVMRKTHPELPRPFKTPLVPLVPILSIVLCGALIYGLSPATKWRLLVWLVIGLVIYFTYSVKHSKVRNNAKQSLNELGASAPQSTHF